MSQPQQAIAIRPVGPIDAAIRPPGSKSITNRALVCAALAAGQSTLEGVLDSDDTRVMMAALQTLGLRLKHDAALRRIAIDGCAGRVPATAAELFVGNSGTTIRFLTAMLTLAHGEYRLDGVPRMRERPIGDLLGALRQLGAAVEAGSPDECPPVLIHARGLRGGQVEIAGDISSQYLSGLLMAAPYAEQVVEVRVRGPLVSRPYVHMTLAVMRSFGVDVPAGDLRHLVVPGRQTYRAITYQVEPDASAASYFLAAAAIAGGRIVIEGLSRRSMQGDVAFADVLARMGCRVAYLDNAMELLGGPLRGIDVDMNPISDTVQTLAAVALFAHGPTTIRGVAHIRHKETDRLGDLATELRKLGAAVDELDDGLRIDPRPLHGAEVDTYDDHRMAMSLALVGLRVPGVVIRDPGCTSKTYPEFFDDLARVSATASHRAGQS